MATGPQKYPGANTAHWHQGTYGGDVMEVNVVVLHTTEGRSLPDYGGGASAPNLTAVPDLAAKRLRWYQHFDIDRSSRALVNLAGGVATNTLNVVQVELVGTCDPVTHKKWTAAGFAHIYWPEAPDWALAEVARFLAWAHAEHGVPLSGPSKWPAYPTSYANSGGQRMTGTQWEAFSGICGHMHVTENVHGDPGAINFAKLIALAKGTTPEEDDVALAADDKTWITKAIADGINAHAFKAVVQRDAIAAPKDAPDIATNPNWRLDSYAKDTNARVRAVQAVEAAQTAVITRLVETVAALAANTAGLDPAAIVAELTAAIEGIKVSINVDGAA